jgi:hypothetical protein
MTEFQFPSDGYYKAFLQKQNTVSEVTIKTYCSALRRMRRDLAPEECFDPAVLTEYRLSMALGTRNIFNMAWRYLQLAEAELGVVLPDLPSLPRSRMGHPLSHDAMTLAGYLNIDQIPKLTWGTLPEHAIDDMVGRALERIYEFQTGRYADTATSDTPLIPTKKGAPMRLWQIEAIINSVHKETDHPVDRFGVKLSEALVFARADGIMLRHHMTAYVRARHSLARVERPQPLFDKWLGMVKAKNFVGLRLDLADRETAKSADPMW